MEHVADASEEPRAHNDSNVRDRVPGTFPPPTPTVFTPVAQKPATEAGHKKSLSGNLLSSLPFFRATSQKNANLAATSPERQPPLLLSTKSMGGDASGNGDRELVTPSSATRGNAPASSLREVNKVKTRSRKGSLRKTAMFGRDKLRRSLEQDRSYAPDGTELAHSPDHGDLDGEHFNLATRAFAHYDGSAAVGAASASLRSSLPGGWTDDTDQEATPPVDHNDSVTGTLHNGRSNMSETSTTTTDDDDQQPLSFSARHTGAGSGSYFPSIGSGGASVSRRRSTKASPVSTASSSLQHQLTASAALVSSAHPPPLAHPPPTVLVSSEDEWDYSETEWWGWVLLAVTWIVFVVGMGSCLGVWSWAWDVGETPYAPPELEDDATLPIVGYYPALIIMTSVVAWVWVVVAWVGMKSFRHAKVVGEER